MSKKQRSPLKIICVIVPRGENLKVAQILANNEVEFQVNCLGEGTAKSNMQSLFGFALSERDVVFGLIEPKKVDDTLKQLQSSFIDSEGNGLCIAFTIPLSGATNTLLDMMGIKY